MPRTVNSHRQHIALPAARVVTGRIVNRGYFTIRKSGGVEARSLMGVLSNHRQIVFFGFMFVCSWCLMRANAASAVADGFKNDRPRVLPSESYRWHRSTPRSLRRMVIRRQRFCGLIHKSY